MYPLLPCTEHLHVLSMKITFVYVFGKLLLLRRQYTYSILESEGYVVGQGSCCVKPTHTPYDKVAMLTNQSGFFFQNNKIGQYKTKSKQQKVNRLKPC